MKFFHTKRFTHLLYLIYTSSFLNFAVPIQELPPWTNKNFMDSSEAKSNANLVVAKDGSGDFLTVNEAVNAAPNYSRYRTIIYVKKGVYSEIIQMGREKAKITIVGDGRDATILTGSLNAKDGIKTFYSATLAVDGVEFIAQDISIQNTAGPAKGQAVALRVSGDMAIVYRCRIDAYQDTLYAYWGRQFYRDCYITGTVDFIFGHAAAVFQYCQIVARRPIGGQSNVITAQNHEKPDQIPSGFSIHKCNITASSDLTPMKKKVKTYLGRPWGVLSTVVIMESYIDDHIDHAGWIPWDSDPRRLSTLYYGEYDNNGPGANTSDRVKWKGYRAIHDRKEASRFTVDQLIGGSLWLNTSQVPYEGGL